MSGSFRFRHIRRIRPLIVCVGLGLGCSEGPKPVPTRVEPGSTPTAEAHHPDVTTPAAVSSPSISLPSSRSTEARDLVTPAPAGSELGDLHVDPDGHLVMTWVEPAPAPLGGSLFMVRQRGELAGEDWSPPKRVVDDPALVVNWADFPRVFSFGTGSMVATWPRSTGEHAYTLMVSFSADRGRTWTPGRELPEVRSSEAGFTSFARVMASDGSPALDVFWLDGRATDGDGGGAMQLRAATLSTSGEFSNRRVIDRRVCDCCQTAAATTPRGSLVIYRDRGATEIRDIRVAGAVPEMPVHDDGWVMPGCPVNGPAIASDPDDPTHLAAAWFTGVPAPGAVLVSFTNLGAAFGEPVRLDAGHPVGRVSLLRFGDHGVVSWMESIPGTDRAVLMARAVSTDAGRATAHADAHRVAETTAGRGSGFPRLATVGDDLVWTYTVVREDQPPRVALVALHP